MRVFITHVAFFVCLATSSAIAQDRGDEVVLTPTGDPHMEAARNQARATLDSFFETERKRPVGTSGFKVKVRFSDGGYTEHFWVQQFHARGSGYEGVLANEPKYVKTVQLGQAVRFRREDITDWGYVKEGRQIGSFTVCAALKRMPKEQADYYRNNHGFDCKV
jgi:uncharacterized protein YegJ (DUF2314 family)